MNILLALGLSLVLPQVRYPDRPAQGEFLLDEAKLLKEDDAAAIRKICGEVLAAKKAPIVVVTIKSLADYGASNWQIQRYAMNLFAEWAVGTASWNYGMLILVSNGDRKARIELGAAWGHLKDADAQKVMQEEIVPRFKRGEFSAGILAGVKGLQRIATAEVKGEPVPQVYGTPPPKPAPPLLPEPSPVEELPPYRPVQNNWIPSTSHSSYGSCLMVGLLVLVGLVLVGVVIKVVKGGGTSTWGAAPSGMSPGCTAFSGGCLGAGLGNMFGGSSYRRYGYYDDPWDRPWGGGWFGGGSSRVDHYHHRDSGSSSSSSSRSSDSSWGSSSSSSDSSSSGGGFSGGGGASGEW